MLHRPLQIFRMRWFLPVSHSQVVRRFLADAVSVNEFLGLGKIKEMSLQGKVVALERPVGTQGLHVVISKRHWRGTTNLYRFNAGLGNLQKNPLGTTRLYPAILSCSASAISKLGLHFKVACPCGPLNRGACKAVDIQHIADFF